MASTQQESNNNNSTEWHAEASETLETNNSTSNNDPDAEFLEEDVIIVRRPQPIDQSNDLSPHPIDRRTFNYLTAVAPIRSRVTLPDVPKPPCGVVQARPFEIVVLPQDSNDGMEGAFPKTNGASSTSESKP